MMLLALGTALLSLVAAVPGTSGAREGDPNETLPRYRPTGDIPCNHTVTPEGVTNSCFLPADLPECKSSGEPAGEHGPFVYHCPPLDGKQPYCNQVYSAELKQFQSVCTQKFNFGGCSETSEDGAYAYTCPWTPRW